MPPTYPWQIVGATILGVIGAATVLMIEHFRQERRRHVMNQDLDRLSRQLSRMRLELDQLRETQQKHDQKGKKNRKRKVSLMSTTTTSTEDYRSANDLDSSEQEFYDLSDDDIVLTSVRTIGTSLEEIDKNLDCGKIEIISETLVIINNMIDDDPNRVDLSWRAAKAYYNIAMLCEDSADKQETIKKGIDVCLNALKVNPNVPELHKWYAILIGSRADFQSMKDRISDGHLFKKHIDIAIELSPSDPSLHHLLGRFAYEVAGLKWYERKAAAALFGEPPSATYQDALDHFFKAEDLSKSAWKENKMLIGKCLIANGDYKDGITWLIKAKNITCKDEVEKRFDSEIQTLLTKYSSYS
ncbi:hypothetical protein AMK59_5254 [Oryctes borbonicus]|uniref:Regulator of microtubule dynamics protein 1 n=1 Tax=Oryctes borbonicus TaxID=1629725 RepID=A0A0T6B4Y9_9SCAR|nr:hypothetical protein AMK59_5254 [Oryctes borbonicus]